MEIRPQLAAVDFSTVPVLGIELGVSDLAATCLYPLSQLVYRACVFIRSNNPFWLNKKMLFPFLSLKCQFQVSDATSLGKSVFQVRTPFAGTLCASTRVLRHSTALCRSHSFLSAPPLHAAPPAPPARVHDPIFFGSSVDSLF